MLGSLAAFAALLMLVLAVSSATSTEHKVRASEREHLDAALKFIRDSEHKTGHIPNREEFGVWTKDMDSKGYNFDGFGYTLYHPCGSSTLEFCIGFWTGDAFVTYRSWQTSMESVRIDDSLSLAFGLLAASLIAGITSKLLLIPRKRPISP